MGKEIGIDLGTTNTVVSYMSKKGHLRQLKYDGSYLIPSVIYFKSEDEYFIGEKAKSRMEANRNQAGIANFKSDLGERGKRYEVVAENGDAFKLRPTKAVTLFLNQLVRGIETRLQKEFGAEEGTIDKAVITVPAKFNDVEKGATRYAAKKAGLDTTKLAYEPTAAAIAYETDQETSAKNEAILVYDFGGGTFDVSVIRRETADGPFKEIATSGDKHLGGNALTRKIEEAIFERIEDDYDFDMPLEEDEYDEDLGISETDWRKNIGAIHHAANAIKEDLSEEEETNRDFQLILPEGRHVTYSVSFDREELEYRIRKEIEKTVEITAKTIEMAKDNGIPSIKRVVLAGGSSNIPMVKRCLEKRLKDLDVIHGDSNDGISNLISRGAAVLAQRMNEIDNMAKQKTNVEYGVKVTDGVAYNKFEMIIPSNEPLPCSGKKTFRLMEDGQREFSVEYYSYDVSQYPNNTRIHEDGYEMVDRLIIDNLPAGLKKSETFIEIEFKVQTDGCMEVNAVIKNNEGKNIAGKDIVVRKESEGDFINED